MRRLPGRLAAIVTMGTLVVALSAVPASADATSTDLGPAASSSGNRIVEAIRTRSGVIACQWQDDGASNYYVGVVDGPNQSLANLSPAVSLVANGTYLFLLAVRGDGQLFLNQANVVARPTAQGFTFIGWQAMNLVTNVAPALGSWGNRSVAVVVAPDGRILYDWWDLGGGGHGFREVPGGGYTTASAAVTLVANGTYMFVLVKGTDNQVWLNQGTPGGAFVGWQPLGIATTVAPGAIAAGNRSAVLVTTPGGRVAYDWWDLGGGTHGLRYLPGLSTTMTAPAAGMFGGGATLLPLATAQDHYVYQSRGTPGGSFSAWQFTL